MAIIFFLLYLGKLRKPRGKFAKTFFLSNFLWKSASPRAKIFSFWRSPGKFFWAPFFFETTCTLCPWLRVFLFLASRSWSLASNFLGPWLWSRKLCPRLHLWPLEWNDEMTLSMLSTWHLPIKMMNKEASTSCLKWNITETIGSRKLESTPIQSNAIAL